MGLHPDHLIRTLLLLVNYGLASIAVLHALLTRPDPRSALSWMAVCWLIPVAGPLLYWLFGINRVLQHRAFELWPSTAAAPLQSSAALAFAADQIRVGAALTRRPLEPGNRIDTLHNGEIAFPRMLRAIEDATASIWLSTYIFQSDPVGRQFVQALAAANRRGVQVRVLIDGVGEWYSWPHVVPMLRRAGVSARRFLPPRLLPPSFSLNCRNHRKILVVDGVLAFMGGMNLGGREVSGTSGSGMSDLHFALRGPVVTQLAQTFAEDWAFAAGERLSAPPPQPASGPSISRVITGGPDQDLDKLLLVILGALSSARRCVQIMTPYFIPPQELVAALQTAALRGVQVSVVLPERSNLRYVDWATLHWLPALVARGVRVHLRRQAFSHAKLFVVDGSYAHIGSVNVDTRSLRLNFEVAVEVYDPIFCGELEAFIRRHEQDTPALTVDTVPDFGPLRRVRNALCWLVSPYL
jgi:cardiolipin synthase A/B